MGGGGSHGSSTVDYNTDIKTRWSKMYDNVSNLVRDNAYSPPGNIAGDPGDTILIDPEHWYGALTETGTSSTALRLFKNLDVKALFTDLAVTSGDTARISTLRAWLNNLWAQLGDTIGLAATKAGMVQAFATRLSNKVEADVIPKLEVGLRNTNAVLSSAIVMGKAAIWDGYNQEVSDYSAKVDFEILGKQYGLMEVLTKLEPAMMATLISSYDVALRRLQVYLEHAKVGMATTLSFNDDWWTKYTKARTIIVEDEIRGKKWAADYFNYLNHAMAALSGAAVITPQTGINAAASTISGAAAGAATGAMIGSAGPQATVGGTVWGAAIGAVVGGVGGYLASQ